MQKTVNRKIQAKQDKETENKNMMKEAKKHTKKTFKQILENAKNEEKIVKKNDRVINREKNENFFL